MIDAQTNETQTLVGLSGLPSGDYIVWATIMNAGGNDMSCSVVGPSGAIEPDPNHWVWVADSKTVSVTGVVTNAPSNASIDVNCGHNPDLGGDNPPTGYATITALPVNSLS